MEHLSTDHRFKIAIARLIISTVFCLNFLSCLVMHAKAMNGTDTMSRCVAIDDINHPITLTKLTQLEATKDVGSMFFRVNVAGFCL